MFCNTWVLCQAAYDNDLVDEGFYISGKSDVTFELERWPNFRHFVELWLERYPDFREYEIFSPLKKIK